MWMGYGSSELTHARLFMFCRTEWRHERAFHMEDAYKWFFHATLGGEHAITSEDGPRARLDDEWETLGPPHEFEQITTTLRPDGAIVRLNLRPYKARNGDKESLLKAFVVGAKKFKRDKADFVAVWQYFGSTLENASIGKLTRNEWQRVDHLTRHHSYPAIDHSDDYQQANAPAYRVLTKKQAKTLIMRLDH